MELLFLLAIAGFVLLWLRQKGLEDRVSGLERALAARESGPAAEIFPSRPAAPVTEALPAEANLRPAAAAVDRAAFLGGLAVEEEEEAEAPRPTLASLFERFVGGRLLIWIGGIALAVAGILLVRFSAGLITPAVRIGLAILLGLLLLAGGEAARRRADSRLDPRVGQALTGAGILVLYAAPYGALVLYHLLSLQTASAAMVAVTAAALILALRHGAPSALMGLAGGFATPILVGDPHASVLPLLAYLTLLDIALFALARRRGWTWLAAAAIVLSFAWTAPFLFARPDKALDAGLFVALLAAAASLIRVGEGWQVDFIRPAAIGLVQLALLAARADLGLPAWALYLCLSAASFPIAARRGEYRPIPALALAAALILLAAAPPAGTGDLLAVAAAITLLFAAGAFFFLLRRPEALLWTSIGCVAAAGPAIAVRAVRPDLLDGRFWGLVFILLSFVPLLFGAHRRPKPAGDRPLFVAAAAFSLLLALAAWQLLPDALVGAAWVVIALAPALAGKKRGGTGLSLLALAAAGAGLAWSAAILPSLWITLLGSLAGFPALAADLPSAGRALEALALAAAPMLALAALMPRRLKLVPLLAASFLLGASFYILFKQAFGLVGEADFVRRGFAERLLLTQALFAAGWLVCGGRLKLPALGEGGRRRLGLSLTALAAVRLIWFDMLVDNPLLVPQSVGPLPLLNLLAPAYLLSAFWLYWARRAAGSHARSGLWLGAALAALVLGVMLMVRQGFEGPILSHPGVPASESYGYSLAGLLLSILLLLGGIRLPDKALRLAGLVLLTATTLKVFLIDASALAGVLRILSFLGLGIALIGIGRLYSKVLDAEAAPAESDAASRG
jgi:uncharacterized membrane protein